MDDELYGEPTRNPFSRTTHPDQRMPRIGYQQIPLTELNMLAMADAYLRGQWLAAAAPNGPCGTWRPHAPSRWSECPAP